MVCSPQKLDLKMFRQASGGCASARQIHHGSVGINSKETETSAGMQCIVDFHYQDLFKNLFWSFRYFLHPESFLQNRLEQEIEDKIQFLESIISIFFSKIDRIKIKLENFWKSMWDFAQNIINPTFTNDLN